MEWLLKIVEGPMNGAEIALVNGMRVSFGRDTNCDIVIADAMLAEKAFELDVTAESVSLVPEGGEPHALVPFEIQTFGATSFALGPAAGEWQELRRPAPAVEEGPSASDAAETPPEATASPEAPASPVEESPTVETVETVERPPRARRVWILLALVLLVSLLLVGVLAWRYGSKFVERSPQTENTPVFDPRRALEDIARTHDLQLRLDPVPCLVGNLKRRTERLAIRALALAADPAVTFDLSDDESLRAAADALLFTLTEGAIQLTHAANRKAVIAGRVASDAALADVIRAMSDDIAGLDAVDASAVTISGAPVATSPCATRATSPRGVTTDRPKTMPHVAGILMVPYPCVVLHNGLRCTEGAILGNTKLLKIEADRLTFEQDGQTFDWKP